MGGENWETGVARRYHEATKHSYESVRRSGHRLDWANRPHPFKEYVGLDAVPLPDAAASPGISALAAIGGWDAPSAPLDAQGLARLLRFGAGVVRTRRLPGGEVYYFRTYSSAGGLYPVEVYAATADGLFHFHPREAALRRLRSEDVRSAAAPRSAAVLLLTGIIWRTAWKYQARGYRHLYWDAGTMLANLLALASSAGLRPRLFTGFVDEELDRLLEIDGRFEATLAALALGEDDATRPVQAPEPLALEVAPLSRTEVRYAIAEEAHAASRLHDRDEVDRYRSALPADERAAPPPAEGEPLERALRRRVSVRDFALSPVPREPLLDLVARALGPILSDTGRLLRAAFVANAVEGLDPGIYDFEPPNRVELVRAEEPRRVRGLAGYLVLEQYLGARAAAVVFLMADLEHAVSALGNRGYRAAQLEAGIVAGRLQIGAFALGWGATCSTFYDDDVSRAVAPERGDSPMLCVALGLR